MIIRAAWLYVEDHIQEVMRQKAELGRTMLDFRPSILIRPRPFGPSDAQAFLSILWCEPIAAGEGRR